MNRITSLLAAAALSACAVDAPDTDHINAGLSDEASQYDADMEFFRKRREAYYATGEVPTVPPSLSSDPHDPEYQFGGYMKIATPEERRLEAERVAASWPPRPTSAELASYSWTMEQELADGTFGVFVNDAGETWRYRPRELTQRLLAMRAARGAPDVRSAAADPGATNGLGSTTQELGILGGDNREVRSAVSGHSMTSYPWRAFGVLVDDATNLANVPDVACSATKIGERYLFTNGHCAFNIGGGAGSLNPLDWWPGGDGLSKTVLGGDPSPYHYKNIVWYYVSEYFIDNGWWSRDYAVLILYDNESSCGIGSLGYRVDNSLIGQDTWNFGYPDENLGCAGSPHPTGKCGGSLWGSDGHITRTEVPYIFHNHDIQGGQSGSAVYDYNGGNRQLVGANQGTYTTVENRGIKIRDVVFDFIDAARDAAPAEVCDY
jgi:V8-like Glu-specific endopeptidase